MGKNNSAPTPAKKKKASSSSPSSPKKWKWSPGSRILSTDVNRTNIREQNLDLVKTLMDGVFIGFCTKSWTTAEASYLHPMETNLNNKETGMNLAKEWKHVFGFLSCRDTSNDDGITAMKTKSGSKWDWKVIVVVINDDDEISVNKAGRHIATCFTKFTKNKDVMDSPEKYTYRQCFSDDPKALNHYLLDMDIAKVLRSLGGYESKDDLIQDEEVLAQSYGTAEYGKQFLEKMEEEDWNNLVADDC